MKPPKIERATETYSSYETLGGNSANINSKTKDVIEAFAPKSWMDLVGDNLLDVENAPPGIKRDSDLAVNHFLQEELRDKSSLALEQDVTAEAYKEGAKNIQNRMTLLTEWLDESIKRMRADFLCVTNVASKLAIKNPSQETPQSVAQADDAFDTLRVFVDDFMEGIEQSMYVDRTFNERQAQGLDTNPTMAKNNNAEAMQAVMVRMEGRDKAYQGSGSDEAVRMEGRDKAYQGLGSDEAEIVLMKGRLKAYHSGSDEDSDDGSGNEWTSASPEVPPFAARVATGARRTMRTGAPVALEKTSADPSTGAPHDTVFAALAQLYPATALNLRTSDSYEHDLVTSMARHALRSSGLGAGALGGLD